jgi:hypothetical protein
VNVCDWLEPTSRFVKVNDVGSAETDGAAAEPTPGLSTATPAVTSRQSKYRQRLFDPTEDPFLLEPAANSVDP